MTAESPQIIRLCPRRFMAGAAVLAVLILVVGLGYRPFPAWAMALVVFTTVIGLFVFGSLKYRLDKNALTSAGGLVVLAMFLPAWWPGSAVRADAAARGAVAWWAAIHENLLTFHGLDGLVHADTMLFLLGLTLFVAVIAQTRLLEGVTFFLLRKCRGRVLPTAVALTAVVAAASGILDGVSMIGLTIRTLVIVLLLAKAPVRSIRFAIVACTAVTTINGIWLAYGEPPNLIMKANLPQLDDRFFLGYCTPAAVLTYGVVAVFLSRKFRGLVVDLDGMDVLDARAGQVRFLQAARHGRVLLPVEFAREHAGELGVAYEPVMSRLHQGQPLGAAMVAEGVKPEISRLLLGRFVDEELAGPLDQHYRQETAESRPRIDEALRKLGGRMALAQRMGALALLPFAGLLVLHAAYHERVPLFPSALAGFAVAFIGIAPLDKMRRHALRMAMHEYAEYLFLFPLFLSITLLSRVGFFDELQGLVRSGVEHTGLTAMAVAQFWGATLLSAILDNNVVADFAGRVLHGMADRAAVYLFAMAQIAGYAAGGCWTHIGSAQSVVAYAFIRRDIDETFTPMDWIKAVTPMMLAMGAVLTAYVVVVGLLHS